MEKFFKCRSCGKHVMYLRSSGDCPLCEMRHYKEVDRELKRIRI
jgi:rubrerythrin